MTTRIFMSAIGLLYVLIATSARSESVAADDQKINPHNGDGHCEVCHALTQDDLQSWFTFTSTKRKLVKDFNEVCRQCHGVKFGHGVGKVPKMNREGLPLDSTGLIACAITCHNMHITSEDSVQNEKHLRLPLEKLCLSCHKG
jgi:hypothetical protein